MPRIKSLDGIRAIAIAMVCLSHLTGTHNSPFTHFSYFGNLGVRVFFVLSGYLITRLLLNELRATGTISLTNFYYRRTLRIFPAFYFYLGCVAVMSWFGYARLQAGDLLYSATYTANYHMERSWWVAHLWSLSVEEQFYLVIPFLMKWGGVKTGLRASLAAVVCAPFLRFLLLPSVSALALSEWFPTTCDALATGCLLAMFMEGGRVRGYLQNAVRHWLIYGLGLVAIAMTGMRWHASPGYQAWFDSFGLTLVNVFIALCVLRAEQHAGGLVGKALNSKPFVFVGTLSYSLYLWQQPFLNPEVHAKAASYPWNLLLAFAAALLSFFLVERPMLRLRSLGTAELAGILQARRRELIETS